MDQSEHLVRQRVLIGSWTVEVTLISLDPCSIPAVFQRQRPATFTLRTRKQIECVLLVLQELNPLLLLQYNDHDITLFHAFVNATHDYSSCDVYFFRFTLSIKTEKVYMSSWTRREEYSTQPKYMWIQKERD